MDLDESLYEPVKPNFYNYYAKNNLVTNIDDILVTSKVDNIHIVAYDVNNNGVYPFLQFLLEKCLVTSVLSLPFIPLDIINTYSSVINTESILKFAETFLLSEIKMTSNKNNSESKIIFDGFYQYNNEVYLFVNLTQENLNINDVYSDSVIRFALVDEILNQKNVCNINIDKYVTDFFNSNYQFSVLKDENNEPYEVPVVSYVGKQENKLNFTYTFGETKQNKNAILGPYYYFTDFTNAFKENMRENQTKSGVVRFAIFIKNIKYIENHQGDSIDESEIKQIRLQDETLDTNYERLTMRISDYDGKWAQNFDSCYLGHIELDNGEYLKNTPIIVVKDYNQQIPLSYHYNKKTHLETHEYAIL